MAGAMDNWVARALIGAALLTAIVAIIVILVDAFGTATDRRIAMAFLINLVVVTGLQIYVGNSGVMSFGHVAFMALGAYGAALFTANPVVKARSIPDAPAFIVESEVGFIAGAIIGIVVAAIFAIIVGVTIVRLSGAAAAVATFGILVVVFTILSNSDQITRGAKAFSGIPPHSTLWWGLAFVAFSFVVARLLRDSGLGLGLRSSREDELAARASGVDVARARLVMWVASAAIAGLGGALYAHFVLAILPKAFHFQLTFFVVTMVIVGGHSVAGALVGAGSVTLIAEFLRRAENGFAIGPLSLDNAPGLTTIVLGLVIVVMMIVRPKGLLGRWELDELLMVRWRRRLQVAGRV